MSKTRIVVAWATAMIFAAGVLTYFPVMSMPRTIRRLYKSELVHIAAHMFLFGVLAALIAGWLWHDSQERRRLFHWRTLLVLLLIFCVGVLQETVQLWGRGLPYFRINEVFDLGVDIAGACIGLALFRTLPRHRHTG